MPTIDVPYLIVGAGPVGLTAARLLANDDRPCLVVERRDGPRRQPAAHVVNARSLEIFRQAGFDMAAIDTVAKDPADAGHVNFVTRLNGELIGRLPFERQGPEVSELTPTPLRNISQHRLEPILSEGVAAMDRAEELQGINMNNPLDTLCESCHGDERNDVRCDREWKLHLTEGRVSDAVWTDLSNQLVGNTCGW